MTVRGRFSCSATVTCNPLLGRTGFDLPELFVKSINYETLYIMHFRQSRFCIHCPRSRDFSHRFESNATFVNVVILVYFCFSVHREKCLMDPSGF